MRLERPLLLGMAGIGLLGAPILALGAHPHLALLLVLTFVARARTEVFSMGWNLALAENVPERMLSRSTPTTRSARSSRCPSARSPSARSRSRSLPRVLVVSGIAYAVICGLVLLSPAVRRLLRAPRPRPTPSDVSTTSR